MAATDGRREPVLGSLPRHPSLLARDRLGVLLLVLRDCAREGDVERLRGEAQSEVPPLAQLHVPGSDRPTHGRRRVRQRPPRRLGRRADAAIHGIGDRDQRASTEEAAHFEEREDAFQPTLLPRHQVVGTEAERPLDDALPCREMEGRALVRGPDEDVPLDRICSEEVDLEAH